MSALANTKLLLSFFSCLHCRFTQSCTHCTLRAHRTYSFMSQMSVLNYPRVHCFIQMANAVASIVVSHRAARSPKWNGNFSPISASQMQLPVQRRYDAPCNHIIVFSDVGIATWKNCRFSIWSCSRVCSVRAASSQQPIVPRPTGLSDYNIVQNIYTAHAIGSPMLHCTISNGSASNSNSLMQHQQHKNIVR